MKTDFSTEDLVLGKLYVWNQRGTSPARITSLRSKDSAGLRTVIGQLEDKAIVMFLDLVRLPGNKWSSVKYYGAKIMVGDLIGMVDCYHDPKAEKAFDQPKHMYFLKSDPVD